MKKSPTVFHSFISSGSRGKREINDAHALFRLMSPSARLSASHAQINFWFLFELIFVSAVGK